jgi:hypothetical protein
MILSDLAISSKISYDGPITQIPRMKKKLAIVFDLINKGM